MPHLWAKLLQVDCVCLDLSRAKNRGIFLKMRLIASANNVSKIGAGLKKVLEVGSSVKRRVVFLRRYPDVRRALPMRSMCSEPYASEPLSNLLSRNGFPSPLPPCRPSGLTEAAEPDVPISTSRQLSQRRRKGAEGPPRNRTRLARAQQHGTQRHAAPRPLAVPRERQREARPAIRP